MNKNDLPGRDIILLVNQMFYVFRALKGQTLTDLITNDNQRKRRIVSYNWKFYINESKTITGFLPKACWNLFFHPHFSPFLVHKIVTFCTFI